MNCSRLTTNPDFPDYFFTSFESEQDTIGWKGLSYNMFVDDPAPNSGKKSLFIGGGCLQPTAYKNLGRPAGTGKFRIVCWGKVEDPYHGGSLKLGVENSVWTELSINKKGWHFYTSDILHYSNGDLQLEIWVGGIAADFISLDCLSIEQLE
jgi:hypothetical protein